MFVLLITGYFKVLYYTEQNRSGFKVFKLKSSSLYSLFEATMQNQFWLLYLGFTFSKILSVFFFFVLFFLLFVLHSSALYNEISGMLLSLELFVL